MVSSSDSSENLDYSGNKNDVNNDDGVLSSIPPSDHSKYTFLTTEERDDVYGPGESSAQPSGFSPRKA